MATYTLYLGKFLERVLNYGLFSFYGPNFNLNQNGSNFYYVSQGHYLGNSDQVMLNWNPNSLSQHLNEKIPALSSSTLAFSLCETSIHISKKPFPCSWTEETEGEKVAFSSKVSIQTSLFSNREREDDDHFFRGHS